LRVFYYLECRIYFTTADWVLDLKE